MHEKFRDAGNRRAGPEWNGMTSVAQDEPSVFRPPTDWESVYATNPNGFTFGDEPSQLCRSAVHYFRAFGDASGQARALDLGSGEGRDTAFLAREGFHVVARDLAPTGLEKTRTLLARHSVPSRQVDLALEDVREFDYPPQAYDLALAANVYQFLPPDEVPAHIRRLQSTVKPGGICAVGVFSPDMIAWGAELNGHFTATGRDLMARFPVSDGWLVVDRTDYATYRLPEKTLASFAFVVARKGPNA
jgi:SAM-dependent methyltransferase